MKQATKHETQTAMNKDAKVIDGLAHLLADTYVLYLKTQNFHWNVTGPHFFEYHKMFEEQYQQLADAVDLLAERMRALHVTVPASFTQFSHLTCLQEAGQHLDATAMIRAALHDHETIANLTSKLFAVAEEAGDEVTLDIFIARKTEHDKTAWMLRSILGMTH